MACEGSGAEGNQSGDQMTFDEKLGVAGAFVLALIVASMILGATFLTPSYCEHARRDRQHEGATPLPYCVGKP